MQKPVQVSGESDSRSCLLYPLILSHFILLLLQIGQPHKGRELYKSKRQSFLGGKSDFYEALFLIGTNNPPTLINYS